MRISFPARCPVVLGYVFTCTNAFEVSGKRSHADISSLSVLQPIEGSLRPRVNRRTECLDRSELPTARPTAQRETPNGLTVTSRASRANTRHVIVVADRNSSTKVWPRTCHTCRPDAPFGACPRRRRAFLCAARYVPSSVAELNWRRLRLRVHVPARTAFHGPVIAKVVEGLWMLTKSVDPSGEKFAPANSF